MRHQTHEASEAARPSEGNRKDERHGNCKRQCHGRDHGLQHGPHQATADQAQDHRSQQHGDGTRDHPGRRGQDTREQLDIRMREWDGRGAQVVHDRCHADDKRYHPQKTEQGAGARHTKGRANALGQVQKIGPGQDKGHQQDKYDVELIPAVHEARVLTKVSSRRVQELRDPRLGMMEAKPQQYPYAPQRLSHVPAYRPSDTRSDWRQRPTRSRGSS